MKEINSLLGGMFLDNHPSRQKENTTREVRNFVPLEEDGNLMSITNESGTTLLDGIELPDGFIVVGHSVSQSRSSGATGT